MKTLRKIPNAMLGTYGYDKGIALGVVEGGKIHPVALLEDHDGRLRLVINDSQIALRNIEITHKTINPL